eukprot:scaffold26928_cov59-Phaeocystis_antarctica.AAC.1
MDCEKLSRLQSALAHVASGRGSNPRPGRGEKTGKRLCILWQLLPGSPFAHPVASVFVLACHPAIQAAVQ